MQREETSFNPPMQTAEEIRVSFFPDNDGAEDVLKIRQQQSMISSGMIVSFSSTMQHKEEMRLRSQTARERGQKKIRSAREAVADGLTVHQYITEAVSVSTLMLSKGEVLSVTNNNNGGNKLEFTLLRKNSEFA